MPEGAKISPAFRLIDVAAELGERLALVLRPLLQLEDAVFQGVGGFLRILAAQTGKLRKVLVVCLLGSEVTFHSRLSGIGAEIVERRIDRAVIHRKNEIMLTCLLGADIAYRLYELGVIGLRIAR